MEEPGHAKDVISMEMRDEQCFCLQHYFIYFVLITAVVHELPVSALCAVHQNSRLSTENVNRAIVPEHFRLHSLRPQEQDLGLFESFAFMPNFLGHVSLNPLLYLLRQHGLTDLSNYCLVLPHFLLLLLLRALRQLKV